MQSLFLWNKWSHRVSQAHSGEQKLSTEILKVLKDKEDFVNVVEIKQNAKGETQVAITVRDDDIDVAIKKATEGYKKTQLELAKWRS